MVDKDLEKQVELAIAQLDREFGKGAVMRLDDDVKPWPAFSTGALNLDIALGIGGLPRGRIVEIFGPEGSGKSTLSLSVIANAQKEGHKCLFVDVEHAIDPVYAKELGVNLDELLLAQPSYGEEALQVLDTMVRTGGISVAVVDSVAALVPKEELDGGMADQQMGLQSRLMSKAMRKLAGIASETKTLIIFTNQIREKIGILFGNPETTPGGRALKFYSSVRIDIRRRETLQDKQGNQSGIRVKAKIIKNKTAPPLRISEFNIIYGKGVDTYRCILDLAAEYDIVRKSGAWYAYEGDNIGQGADNAALYLRENPELAEKLKKEIMTRV